MSRIRGLYVAQIILAVDKERNESTLLPEKIGRDLRPARVGCLY